MEFRVCFVGIGSIAKRHIRNLMAIAGERNLSLVIDAVSRGGRKEESPFEVIHTVYTSTEEMKAGYDVIFITNPTELHLDTLQAVTDKGRHFFLEKPVASMGQLEAAKQFVCNPGSVYYVACPLRYNAVIQYLKEQVDLTQVISVRSISSSYLPDWRPGIDYRDTYSAHKDLGGGVSIDLIHEWDYLTFLFGQPKHVHGFVGKKSDLEIDSDDYAIYIAEYEDKIAELHLDYFGRKTIREVQLFLRDETILGDIANSRITFLKSGKTIDFKEERDDFQKRELRYFLDLVEKGTKDPNSDIAHGIAVMELTRGDE